MHLFSRVTSASIILGTLILPTTSMAASSQQLLDRSLTNLILVQPSAFSGTLEINETATPLTRDGLASKKSAKLQFAFERSVTASSSQGFVQMDQLNITPDTAHPTQTTSLSEPVRATFRTINDTTYIKASPLGPLVAMMGLGGAIAPEQVASYERWLSIDTKDASAKSLPIDIAFAKEENGLFDQETLKAKLALAAKKRISPLRVISMTPVKGYASQTRIRARVNPAFLSMLEQQELKQAGKNIAQKKEIQVLYKKARESSKNLVLVFLIETKDSKQPVINRVEFATDEVSIEKGCGYARYTKNGTGIESSYSCTLSTQKTKTHIAGGIDILKKEPPVVEVPADAVSLSEVLTNLFQPLLGDSSAS